MTYNEQYLFWCENARDDKDLLAELFAMKDDEKKIKERFSDSLSFGTAGLRGVLGAGTNAMNIYTLRRAVAGYANFLLDKHEKPSVAIAYDSRNKSELLAKEAAAVLAAHGIVAHIFQRLMPTPILSFAVRELSCDGGLIITASHNPAQYNGLKVYGADGGQLADQDADIVVKEIEKIGYFDIAKSDFDKEIEAGNLIKYIDDGLLKSYYEGAEKESFFRNRPGLGARLKLAFTPLNGTGHDHVLAILNRIGISEISVVAEQAHPDGNFPSCPYPNPEFKEALELGIKLGQKENADILIATDPDADRLGVVVFTPDGYKILSGNEVGILIFHYIVTKRMQEDTMPRNPVAARSIVSSSLMDRIGSANRVEVATFLTGFKNVAALIRDLGTETARFLFGYEEACGYLSGTFVRDKDAITASMLICEIAAFYKSNGKNLLQILDEIYSEFGLFYHPTDNYSYEGIAGKAKIKGIMDALRQNPFSEIAGLELAETLDYLKGEKYSKSGREVLNFRKTNAIEMNFVEGSKLIIRPSGTEPKIKLYYTFIDEENGSVDKLKAKHEAFKSEIESLLALGSEA